MELFLDLQRKLTSDPVFTDKVKARMAAIQDASRTGDKMAVRRAMLDMLRLCEFNPSLLVPFFFPSYPFNKPMTLWTRPHAMGMLSVMPNATITVCTGRQTGKCCTGDTTVPCRESGEHKTLTLKQIFDKAKTQHKPDYETSDPQKHQA